MQLPFEQVDVRGLVIDLTNLHGRYFTEASDG